MYLREATKRALTEPADSTLTELDGGVALTSDGDEAFLVSNTWADLEGSR